MGRDGRRGFSYLWWEIKEAFRKDPQAMWFSIIAVTLGIGPGWTAPVSWSLLKYDPGTTVLTATLIALIWTANYTYKSLKQSREEAEAAANRRIVARETLMASLISEFEVLYVWLEAVEARLLWAWYERMDLPMLRHVLLSTELLTPDEAAALTGIERQAKIVQVSLDRLAAALNVAPASRAFPSAKDAEKRAPSEVENVRTVSGSLRTNLSAAARLLSPIWFEKSRFAIDVPPGDTAAATARGVHAPSI